MDNTLQDYSSSLIADLSGWNRQEQKFRELFSDDSLKDREFLKMKLAEFNRIFYKHDGTAKTTDERAFMTILGFHRKKLEKALYPGLLTRLVVRAYAFVSGLLQQRADQIKPANDGSYHLPSIPVPALRSAENGDASQNNGQPKIQEPQQQEQLKQQPQVNRQPKPSRYRRNRKSRPK